MDELLCVWAFLWPEDFRFGDVCAEVCVSGCVHDYCDSWAKHAYMKSFLVRDEKTFVINHSE